MCYSFGDMLILARERTFVNHLATNFEKIENRVAFGDKSVIIPDRRS